MDADLSAMDVLPVVNVLGIGRPIKPIDVYNMIDKKSITPPSGESNISKYLDYTMKRFPVDKLSLADEFKYSHKIVTVLRRGNGASDKRTNDNRRA